MTGLETHAGEPEAAASMAASHLEDPLLTAFGLLHEVHFGALDTVERDLESFGFTLSTFEVLLRLSRSADQRLRMSELTAQCTITSSGLTRVIDRMASAGWVVREPCESDRRGFFAVLTPHGMNMLVSALPTHRQTLDKFWSVLDEHEFNSFVSSLRKLRAVVIPGSDPAFSALD